MWYSHMQFAAAYLVSSHLTPARAISPPASSLRFLFADERLGPRRLVSGSGSAPLGGARPGREEAGGPAKVATNSPGLKFKPCGTASSTVLLTTSLRQIRGFGLSEVVWERRSHTGAPFLLGLPGFLFVGRSSERPASTLQCNV